MAQTEFLRVLAHTVGVLSLKPVKPATLTRAEYLESAQAWAQLITDPAWKPSELSQCDELVHRGAGESSGAWVELTMLYNDWRNSTTASANTDPRS